MQLTKNFTITEFGSKDGTPVPSELFDNVAELARNLQVIRDKVGKPVIINSGYRSPDHNKAIGGKPSSYHLKAMAADIRVVGVTPKELHKTIKNLMDEGSIKQGGLSQYPTFVHYDIRGWYATW